MSGGKERKYWKIRGCKEDIRGWGGGCYGGGGMIEGGEKIYNFWLCMIWEDVFVFGRMRG